MTMALIPVVSASDLEEANRKKNQALQASPVIQELASHVRKRWDEAKEGKRELEQRMLDCQRQRNGEYDPQTKAQIKQQGGSEIFIQLTSVKCRAATSWLRDTLMGSGSDKPWSIDSTPEPEMPPEILEGLRGQLAQQLEQHMMMGGVMPDEETLRQMATAMKDEAYNSMVEESRERVGRMERKMEDQLVEGGWMKAFNEFVDDIVTFPFAAMKGPIKRRRKVLKWVDGKLTPTDVIRNEWARVDPYMLYWAPWAEDINDGYVIERHRLTAAALQSYIGVPGYNDAAIRTVLASNNAGILNDWLWIDSAKAEVEGKMTHLVTSSTDLIDALQLWDSVPGRLLLQWGMDKKNIPDPDLSYPCEVWLVGNNVIRAVLNYDALGRTPYYMTSYEKKPGSVDGKGVADLCRDSQAMVNATARSMANNMGISSGPQVGVNISRLPDSEDIETMYPWKIWQFTDPEFNTNTPPLDFFQPSSNAQELMGVFEKFASRADEDTMIPRYMTGEHTPGVGRTSSGMSMMISNAGKGIKQVINNIDKNVIVPAIERLYQDNLRYADDPDLVGDVQIVARGASSLVVKEAEAVRRNEFLQMLLNSPVAQQISGQEGIAELMRDAASNLNSNPDRIVPSRQNMSTIQQQQQIIQQLQMQLQQAAALIQGTPNEMIVGDEQGGQGAPQGPAPQNILPDGSQVGGRQGNLMSPRPNGQ